MSDLTKSASNQWLKLQDLRDEINSLFDFNFFGESKNSQLAAWAPKVDVKEKRDKYLIHADLPGMKPQDVKVSFEHGVLTIRGERETEAKNEDDNFVRIERRSGSFYRSFNLPDAADEKISAKMKDGVLEIVLPKEEGKKGKDIKIEG